MKIPELSKKQWITVAVVAVVIIVLFIIVVRLAKRGKERSDDREKERELARLSQEIINAGGRPSELTSSQVENIAKRIKAAQTEPASSAIGLQLGWGTDEEGLVSAIESIPTASDYILVKAKYLSLYHSDMWTDIIGEFTINDGPYGQINAHLNLIGVPVNMR